MASQRQRYSMLRFSRMKLIAIAFIVTVGLLFAVPSFLPSSLSKHWPTWLPQNALRMGVEFTGGSRVVMKVDRAEMTRAYFVRWREDLRDFLRESRLGHAGIQIEKRSMLASFRTVEDRDKAYDEFSKHYNTGFLSPVGLEAVGELSIRLSVSQSTIDSVIDKSIEGEADVTRH